MEAAASKPLFQSKPLPACVTPGDQFLALILGELIAIRELLSRGMFNELPETVTPLDLREPAPKTSKRKA
jgi:hypothetical protein